MVLSSKKTRGFRRKSTAVVDCIYKKISTDNLLGELIYTKIKNLGSESKVIHSFPDFFVIQIS